MIASLLPIEFPTNPQIAPPGPPGPASRRGHGQLGPQQLRYMALRSDSSAPACLRPSSVAARAAPSAAAWGASPASRSRAPAPAALSLCARTAATVAATHTRLISSSTSSFPISPLWFSAPARCAFLSPSFLPFLPAPPSLSAPPSRSLCPLMHERSPGPSPAAALPVLLLSLSLLAGPSYCWWCSAEDQACSPPMGFRSDGSPATGGGISEKGRFSYGFASCPGKRASMEDFYETRVDDVDGETVGLFGVFDGHGGARAAEYVKKHLFSNLIKHPKFMTETNAAIAETFNHTDSEFLKADSSHSRDAGSTASTAILVGGRLVVANVGDSRAVVSKGGKAIAVSRDHKPDQTDERQRIEEAGGFVMWAGTWRVGGVLAVSRAFGDKLLKQYVVADPEIKEEVVDGSLEFLILASDGLWDVVTNDEAVAMVKPIEDPEQAAKRLLQEASVRGSADNITVVIVRFLDGTTTTGAGPSEEVAKDQSS